MRRSAVLRGVGTAITLAGLLALWPVGPWVGDATVAAAVVVLAAPWVGPRLPRGWPWGPVAVGVAVGAALTPALLGRTVAESLGLALLVLAVARRLGRAHPRDDRLSALLALLMLVLGGTRAADPVVGVAVAGWVALAPVLAVLATLEEGRARQERERAVVGRHLRGLSLAAVALMAVGFVALPRLRGAELGGHTAEPARTRVGYAEQVELGDLDQLLDDPGLALRLALPPDAPAPALLRGRVLDHFDGRSWRATGSLGIPDPAGARPYRIQQEAEAGPVAFAPGVVVRIEAEPPGFRPADGAWRLVGPPRRLRYTAWSLPLEAVPAPREPRHLQLPDDLDPRVPDLARRVAGEADGPLAAARALEAYLEEGYGYTRAPRDTTLDAPLTSFLFERRTGHCEYFATSLAVLLRSLGHPSRLVTGYARPRLNPVTGHWTVRRGHAHAWVEVRGDDARWHAVDPTPGGSRPPPEPTPLAPLSDAVGRWWTEGVLAYDGGVQVAALTGMGGWIQAGITGRPVGQRTPWLGLGLLLGPFAIALATSILAFRALGRRLAGEPSPRPSGRVARLHHRARRAITRAGVAVPDALPPVEAARWVQQRAPAVGDHLEALAWLHYRVRYGGEDDGALAAPARRSLAALRRALAATKRDESAPERAEPSR